CTCSSGGPCFKHPYAPNGSYTLASPGTVVPVGSPSEPAPLKGTGYVLAVDLTGDVATRSGYSIAQHSPHQDVMPAPPSDAGERKAAPPHLGGPWPDAVSSGIPRRPIGAPSGIPRRPIGAQRSPHQDVML